MKELFTVIFFLNVVISWAQDLEMQDLGIGFVIAENPYQYEDGSSPSNIYLDKKLSEKISNLSVAPFFMKPDYGLYHFICTNKTGNYYEIYVNEKQKAYVPNNSKYYFKSWDALLIGRIVQRIDQANQIRIEADEGSDIIVNACEIDQLEVLQVIEKKGEFWMSIRFSEECDFDPDEDTQMKSGWIKWRTQHELLVNILLLC